MSFHPAHRPVPTGLRRDGFVLRPLTTDLAVLDHAAYLASPEVIRQHGLGRWPVAGFTLVDDLGQIGVHEQEHRDGTAFAFAVLTPDAAACLGSVYLRPLLAHLVPRLGRMPPGAADLGPAMATTAQVTFWIRQDHQETGLPEQLVRAVSEWLARDWGFADHLFRVSDGERRSIAALDRVGMVRRLRLPGPVPGSWWRWHGGRPVG